MSQVSPPVRVSLLLSSDYNAVVQASITAGVTQLDSFVASEIPAADFVWLANKVVSDINIAAARKSVPATSVQKS
jgi:hypothetical protein